ncbi:hypothetical protein K493DRAFT_58154 [Basidiobolus meristosporus CBS 931.73]|uniref:Uncharacterized protein n=1 Tax=Basidiobolus meristosporus CBS 931.73 TaxID=1314790 RepID=A0A1Y1WBW7_9FUNG|nr:hypothetical protein K493DRAFT_4749 [Basidiobolus meristosporus CBS 931.73]ORX90562.1 hypothetical protein K493DRAFT_58154 [Basidiobolus meristosporus CBS 931.73]|eukprot:ORX71023.1 hypothetical protein K493DRAFT_4749 [Basidiobolus meristosporus CBS 931.73]
MLINRLDIQLSIHRSILNVVSSLKCCTKVRTSFRSHALRIFKLLLRSVEWIGGKTIRYAALGVVMVVPISTKNRICPASPFSTRWHAFSISANKASPEASNYKHVIRQRVHDLTEYVFTYIDGLFVFSLEMLWLQRELILIEGVVQTGSQLRAE